MAKHSRREPPPTEGTWTGTVASDLAHAKYYYSGAPDVYVSVHEVLRLLEAFVTAIEAVGPEVCERALREAKRRAADAASLVGDSECQTTK